MDQRIVTSLFGMQMALKLYKKMFIFVRDGY